MRHNRTALVILLVFHCAGFFGCCYAVALWTGWHFIIAAAGAALSLMRVEAIRDDLAADASDRRRRKAMLEKQLDAWREDRRRGGWS